MVLPARVRLPGLRGRVRRHLELHRRVGLLKELNGQFLGWEVITCVQYSKCEASLDLALVLSSFEDFLWVI